MKATFDRATNHSRRLDSSTFDGAPRVVFFGKSVSAECGRCGAYASTGTGHKYCAHVTCPLALKEIKRRNRKRTSTLEKVYMPRMQRDE